MRTIKDINFKGLRAIVRVDFNVPLNKDLTVGDATRIEAAIPTINKILKDGGSVVLMSHMGRPKGEKKIEFSLLNIKYKVEELLNLSIMFIDDCVGDKVKNISQPLKPGEVLMVENLRFYKEETEGDDTFAKKLSELGDVYVNDAFGTAHRAHASTTIIANYFTKENKCFGLLMAKEIENLERVLSSPKRPNIAIIGGAKVSSKIDVLKSLILKMDAIIIGGGMAYTFIKSQGGDIGTSLVENDKLSLAHELMAFAKEKGVKLHLPVDSLNADDFNNNANTITSNIREIPDGFMGLDIGPKSIGNFKKVLLGAKTILWNGPLGVFEFENFAKGTREVANTLVTCTKNGAFTLVGGGDSVAAAKQFGVADNLSYISTGGGAMLESLEGKVLPGIQAILD